jgi:nucleotide-binding universal stress UspA family protein
MDGVAVTIQECSVNDVKGRIVVGVDGSDASLDAIRWAYRQAQLTGCVLEAVACWHIPDQYAELVAEEIDWNARAESLLGDALAAVKDGGSVQITRTSTQGHPAKVLTDASKGADLLVVGSRGHGGFVGMLLGSVSVHVSAHAHCPVVVVRHHGS